MSKESAISHPVLDINLPLAGRPSQPTGTVIYYKGQEIGAKTIAVIAGSCSVESKEQIMTTAQEASKLGIKFLRGGAYKPRTSPYEFQGLGEQGLIYLQQAAETHNMLSVSEILDPDDLEMAANYVDILQIGTRNMHNYSLLKCLGKVKNPILLKRGFAATYREFLLAAEYILNTGNPNVILCERGIRSFDNFTRFTLDIAAVPILKELSHLPVIVDPSHAVGIRRFVPALARAAIAAGADGLLIEAHPEPDLAVSDAAQTISLTTLKEILVSLQAVANSVGRQL